MNDHSTPEEKLLNLIKGKKANVIPQRTKDGKDAAVRPSPENILPQKDYLSPLEKFFPWINLQLFLFLFLILACLYLIVSVVNPVFDPRKITASLKSSVKSTGEPLYSDKNDNLHPLEYYLSRTSGRQIFNQPQIQEPVLSPAETPIDTDSINDITLVGIITSDGLQAIIENKKSQKTHYLNKGQFVGNFQVEDIQENKIILNLKGKRYELKI